MRRPQVGQSLRSRCASWPHQGQKRRFSTAHGSRDCEGASGSTLPTIFERLAGVAVAVDLARLGLDEVSRARWRGCAGGSAVVAHRRALYLRAPPASARPWLGLRRVRVLIFHGYLLGGTGSNVYNARLAEALVRLGHEVHLLCQERHPEEHGFVDAAGDWDTGTLRVRELRRPARAGGEPSPRAAAAPPTGPTSAGCCPCTSRIATRACRRGRSPTAATRRSARYLDANVAAVARGGCARAPAARARQPPRDGPGDPRARARRCGAVRGEGPRQRARVHRQAAARALPARPRARASLGARGVLVGSRHTAESLWAALGGESWLASAPASARRGWTSSASPRARPRAPAPACAQLAARLRARAEAAGPERPGSGQAASAFDRDELEAAPRSRGCVRITISSSPSWAS